MSVVTLAKGFFNQQAMNAIKKTEIVLDIGCGIMPQSCIKPSVHICVEPFAEYIKALQQKVLVKPDRHYIIIQATWHQAVEVFPPKSVDSIFLLDVIEHLDKEEGRKLLKATEKIARQQIVIFTPLGFLPQHHPDGRDIWGYNGGAWQEHRSGWTPDDLGDSYDIFVCESYHQRDNQTYGAIWAVKNINPAG
ncbi:MAG: class I SAM-dependent methyltransferase [Syntrophomonas sp.]